MACEVKVLDQTISKNLHIIDPRAGLTPLQEEGAVNDAIHETRWYDPETVRIVNYTIDGKLVNLVLPTSETDINFLNTYWELLCEIPPDKQVLSIFVYGVGSGFDLSACIYTLAPDLIAGSNLVDAEWKWLETHAPDLYESCSIKLTGGAYSLANLEDSARFDLISAVRGGFSSLDTQEPLVDPETAKRHEITSNHQALLKLFSLRQNPGGYLITDVFTKEMEGILRTAWGKSGEEPLHRGFFTYRELIQLINRSRTQLFAQNGYRVVDVLPYSHTNLIEQYFKNRRDLGACTDEVTGSPLLHKNPEANHSTENPDFDLPTHWIVLAQRSSTN